MQLIPAKPLMVLAELLMLIEGGTPWPRQLQPSRAHLLNKDPLKPHDPLSYRCLLLTALLYRIWGKVRLRDLQPWISSWRLDEIHGGLSNVGADDAWYKTALDVEFALLYNHTLVEGVVDLFKCFDQII